MNNNNNNHSSNTTPNARPICKLGLDCHAGSIMVARQLEGLNPQPPQKFKVESFLGWIDQQAQKYQIYSCYEAGPTGYWLHRHLQRLGVTNYVVCPTRLDSRHKGVNTDKTDATELLVRLDRYVAGNKKAFAVVAVPSPEQEQKRAFSRQREQLRCQRLRLAAQGRMLLLSQGFRYSNNWWKSDRWEKLPRLEIPQWVLQRLATFKGVIDVLTEKVLSMTASLSLEGPKSLPTGMGRLTHEVLEREIRDWSRFQNRRQIASYGALTGGVSGSGEQQADLSLTKAGNRRISSCLIECAWRLVRAQPNYWLVKKWAAVLNNPRVHRRRRKQAIVAFARQLLVDLWKWKQGKATPQALGWSMIQFQ